MSTKEQRKRLKAFYNENERNFRIWVETGYPFIHRGVLDPLPVDLVGLRCGAKTKAGTPCKLRPIRRNGRCKFHGGLSTGPKTVEGKKKVSLNAKKQTPCSDRR